MPSSLTPALRSARPTLRERSYGSPSQYFWNTKIGAEHARLHGFVLYLQTYALATKGTLSLHLEAGKT